MNIGDMMALRYPIGDFHYPESVSPVEIPGMIEVIEHFPVRLRKLVEGFSKEQLDTPYRPEGWTVRQVVHHCGDSHTNSLIRFRLGLTEDHPTIKPYFEDRWANLPDYQDDVAVSLKLIEAVHGRWVSMLRNMSAADFERTLFHPESHRVFRLDALLALYAWHCEHHFQHIYRLAEREGWL